MNHSIPLKLGKLYLFPDGSVWRVERISPCSAIVKCVTGAKLIGTRHVEFGDGREEDFDVYDGPNKPGKKTEISPNSILDEVEEV